MILLLAGTSEGRELAMVLENQGCSLLVTTVTEYGAYLAASREVLTKALTELDLVNLIRTKAIKAIIDATHPYAKAISTAAIKACQIQTIPYLRFERQTTGLSDNPLIYQVKTYQEAAKVAGAFGETIFLTIGTRNLEAILSCPEIQGKRLIVRVLPEVDSIQMCRELGFLPRNIIAMQGPFSKALNQAMFKELGTSVIVTKESGARGGTDTKIEAAQALGLPAIIVERPALDYPQVAQTIDEVIIFLGRID